MRNIPVSVMITWPRPNYVDPETRGNSIIYVLSPFLFVSATTVGLRLYTRTVVNRWFGWDDVLIILGLVCYRTLCIKSNTQTMLLQANHGIV